MPERAILLDIEGTTTSISFVYDTLFPFARAHLARHLEDTWDTQRTRQVVEDLRALVLSEAASPGSANPLPEGRGPEVREAAISAFLGQMDADRKTTPLKAIQGDVWKAGYASGALKGHVYDDVPHALRRWNNLGKPVYIYSSGSVAAQKLLFGASEAGDLLPLLAGHFDTTTGPKKEAASYEKIAAALGLPTEDVTFATDNLDEARAARAAGMAVRVAERPGNPPLAEHDFETIRSFDGW